MNFLMEPSDAEDGEVMAMSIFFHPKPRRSAEVDPSPCPLASLPRRPGLLALLRIVHRLQLNELIASVDGIHDDAVPDELSELLEDLLVVDRPFFATHTSRFCRP